jgi:hypothetical protein
VIKTSSFRGIAFKFSALVLIFLLGFSAKASEQEYVPHNEEEVEILSLVVGAEIKANNWPISTMVCFTVGGLDPSAKLTKSIRARYPNVRSSAEWKKKFNCGFELQLEYAHFDLSGNTKVRSKVIDLREINNGTGHIAGLVKDGEYCFEKVHGKWSVKGYAAKALG